MQEIAPGVGRLPITIGNVYFVGAPGEPWFLVDTGTPGGASKIQGEAERRYGPDARPEAILLTHGHSDHVGNAAALSDFWNVPIYAHRLELPYVTGRSPYPPKDPTVGGAMAMLMRVFPMTVADLGTRVEPLPDGGNVPGLPGWEWLPTPGHSPGHVAFYRAEDRTLLAGDAFATVNMNSLVALVTQKPEIFLPPPPVTCDWGAARASVERLAALEPSAVGCGHGVPLSGPTLAGDLRRFSETFMPPAHGRYVPHPAVTDEKGIVSLPPPAPDLFPLQTALVVGAAAGFQGAGEETPLRRLAFRMDALSYYGNVASLIGLLLSLGSLVLSAFTLWKVSDLRRHYTFVGTGDDFVNRLRVHADELTSYLNNFAGFSGEVLGQLAQLRATVEGLNSVAPAPHQKSLGRLLKRIRSYHVQPTVWQTLLGAEDHSGEPGLRYIYNELLYTIQVTKDAQESIKMAVTPIVNGIPTLVEGVAKLIQLTQEGRVKWIALRPESIPLNGQDYERVEAAYEAVFSGRHLRLYKRSFKSLQRRSSTTFLAPQNEFYPVRVEEVVLENLDDKGNVVYTFPDLDSIANLLSAVQYQTGGKGVVRGDPDVLVKAVAQSADLLS